MSANWQIEKLSAIAKIMYGHTAKSSSDMEGPKYLRITDIQDSRVDWNAVPSCPSLNGDFAKYSLQDGDIVFARTGATTGKSFLIKDAPDAVFASYLIRVQADYSLLTPEFLSYFFQTPTYWETIDSGISGSAQGGFNAKKLGGLKIPIPPLPEQERIVAKLDTAFAAIDAAKANTERNLQNAKELFQSKLNEVFSQSGDGWVEKKLGDACVIAMGQSPKGTSYNDTGEGVPLINGPVEFGKEPFSKTIKSKFTTAPTKMCKEGDMILCVRGSTTGRINIAGFEACIGRGVASIRFVDNQIWLNYFIRAKQQEIYDLGTGATFPNVSGKMLSEMSFPIPSSEVQHELVSMMKALDTNTGILQTNYTQKLTELEDLKKSLLERAFKGEI